MSSRAGNESSGRFSWAEVYEQLGWLPDGGLNIAHEAIDRHAGGPRGDDPALVWVGRHGEREEHTFEDLSRLTSRFGNLLRSLGIEKGDRICTSLGRLPELYVALLGILKAGAVAVPLPARAGPDAIKSRMLDTRAKVLLTDPETRRSLYTAVFEMFDLQHIVVVNKNGRDPLPPETADLDYDEEMGKAPDSFIDGADRRVRPRDGPLRGRRARSGAGAPVRRAAFRHRQVGHGAGRRRHRLVARSARDAIGAGAGSPRAVDVGSEAARPRGRRRRGRLLRGHRAASRLGAPRARLRTGGHVSIGKGHRGRPRSEQT